MSREREKFYLCLLIISSVLGLWLVLTLIEDQEIAWVKISLLEENFNKESSHSLLLGNNLEWIASGNGLWNSREKLQDNGFEAGDYWYLNGVSDGWHEEKKEAAKGEFFLDKKIKKKGRYSQGIKVFKGNQPSLGISQKISLERKNYLLSFFVKSQEPGIMKVKLESLSSLGKTLLYEKSLKTGLRWQNHFLSLPGPSLAKSKKLKVGFYFEKPTTYWIDEAYLLEKGAEESLNLEPLLPLKISFLRFPGGILSDDYHWQKGIGPLLKREGARTYFGAYFDNDFGFDEFMKVVRSLGAEAMITVNFGSATPEEAASWVAYANKKEGKWAALRAQNSQKEPYNISYWEIGNEIYGSWETGGREIMSYVERARSFIKAMKKADPKIKIGAPALLDLNTKGDFDKKLPWTKTLIEKLGDDLDFLSVHYYLPFYKAKEDAQIMKALNQFEERIRTLKQFIKEARASHLEVFLTEYGFSYGKKSYQKPELANLKSALYLGELLKIIIKERLKIAAYWSLLDNGYFGAFKDTKTFQKRPAALVLELFNKASQGKRLKIVSQGKLEKISFLGTKESQNLYLYLINRNDHSQFLEIRLDPQELSLFSRAKLWQIRARGLESNNERREEVRLTSQKTSLFFSRKRLVLPAYSISLLEINL